jgi:hypothetical protein
MPGETRSKRSRPICSGKGNSLMKLIQKMMSKTAATLGVVALSLGLGACAVELSDQDIRDVEQLAGPWEGWLDQPTLNGGFADSPAILSVPAGTGIFGRALGGAGVTANRYRATFHRSAPPTSWFELGTSTFASKPAGTTLDASFGVPEAQLTWQYALFGRKTDNKLYVSTWKVDSTFPYTSAPTNVIPWTAVGATTYASAPATALAGGALYLIGRKSDNRIYLRRNFLTGNVAAPINHANWSGEFAAAPNLPAGWVAQGDPAAANGVPINSRIHIFVRAFNAGLNQSRIYRMRFNVVTTTWDASWAVIPTTNVTITTDPAAEYDNEDKITLYLKGNGRIYQASEINGVWQAFTTINNNTFVGSPGAVGDVPSPGSHWVVAKKSDNQLQLVITQQGH